MEKVKSKEFIKLCKKYGVDPDKVPEVLTFNAACSITGDNAKKLPVVSGIKPRNRKRLIADHKLSVIAEALGGGNPDYTNTNEYKYYAVFAVKADMKRKSGFGLSYYAYDNWRSDSFVGVRLCFPTWDQARFFGMHFIDLHTDHHLLT